MHMYVCPGMCVCVYICVCPGMCVCLHMCVPRDVCMCVCVCVRVPVYGGGAENRALRVLV